MNFFASRAIAAFLLFFILFWSSLTLAFDYQLFGGMLAQLRTLSFQSTQGEILQSSVKTHKNSDGDTYSLIVSYRYQVNRTEYTSDKYRFGTMSTNYHAANKLSKRFNSHPSVTVYFNPAIPSEAVLMQGIEGVDLFTILFITPFNMVMLGGWWCVFIWLARLYRKPEAGGVKYLDQDRQTIIKLHYKSPLAAALGALGACAFIGIFIVVILFGTHPPLVLMVLVWIIISALAVYAAYHCWRQNQSGSTDFIIDDSRQTVSFCPMQINPENITIKNVWKTGQFAARVSVPRSQIQNIFIESKTTTDSDGDSKTNYFPTIQWQQQAVLMMTTDKEQVEEFVEWLRRRIGFTAHTT
jgi:Protein of unknown function (DUF3592)